jgi:hypothetical protein
MTRLIKILIENQVNHPRNQTLLIDHLHPPDLHLDQANHGTHPLYPHNTDQTLVLAHNVDHPHPMVNPPIETIVTKINHNPTTDPTRQFREIYHPSDEYLVIAPTTDRPTLAQPTFNNAHHPKIAPTHIITKEHPATHPITNLITTLTDDTAEAHLRAQDAPDMPLMTDQVAQTAPHEHLQHPDL